ncbi:MAG: response regulator [Magnetococcales bacterium]|nr:response regulator [Magnetococcales bacterium]
MKTILCVEDDAQLLGLYSRMLQDQGFAVLTAHSGESGLEVLRIAQVDLLITDILMPDMDGVELIFHVLSLHPDLPILAISGGGQYLSGSSLLKTVSLMGVQGTLLKPFSQEALIATVFGVLGE